jgi:hypothetical protein
MTVSYLGRKNMCGSLDPTDQFQRRVFIEFFLLSASPPGKNSFKLKKLPQSAKYHLLWLVCV